MKIKPVSGGVFALQLVTKFTTLESALFFATTLPTHGMEKREKVTKKLSPMGTHSVAVARKKYHPAMFALKTIQP